MSASLIFSRNYQQCRQFLINNWQLDLSPQPDLICYNEDRQGLSIEEIRNLEQLLIYPPYKLPTKTIILANFDQAGIPAQNAFLKMLEEHPEYVKFILHATSEQKVLDTIKSRCQLVTLNQEALASDSTILAETFISLIKNSNHAQLIEWCATHKEREEAVNFLNDLLTQLHRLMGREPNQDHTLATTEINRALVQIEQNFNVLLTLENCLFTIKSRF